MTPMKRVIALVIGRLDNEKMKEKLMCALADLVCMHLDYEIKAREEKEEEK